MGHNDVWNSHPEKHSVGARLWYAALATALQQGLPVPRDSKEQEPGALLAGSGLQNPARWEWETGQCWQLQARGLVGEGV